MPLYDYDCDCGWTGEIICPIDASPPCPQCDGNMKRLISSTHGINMGVGAYGYYDDNLQAYVSTNRQKKELMRKQGVSEAYGKGWS